MESELSPFEKIVSFDTTFSCLLLLFLTVLAVQLYFYFAYFFRLAVYQKRNQPTTEKKVSVIIAAKNERTNLEQYLGAILTQNYPVYEVIVVDNNSTDGTQEYLKSLSYKNLVVLFCEEEGKKAAVQKGIEAAKYPYLVFTDADCKPASANWLALMAMELIKDKEIVLGFGAFFKENTLLNSLIRFEGVLNATQYLSFALKNKAYMGVGRNMAYSKRIYKESTVFKKHSQIKSGDDDLVINEMAQPENVAICVNKEAHTYTSGEQSWGRFYQQKRRQLQAGNFYKKEHKRRLAYFGASNFLFYLLFVILLCYGELGYYILGIFVVKQIVEYILFNWICKKLENRDIVKWIPILEPIYLITITIIGVSTWFWNVKEWK